MRTNTDSEENIAILRKKIQEKNRELEKIILSDASRSFSERERLRGQLSREIADLHSAIDLQDHVKAQADNARRLMKEYNNLLKNKGSRIVHIRFLGGSTLPISTPYYSRNCDEKPSKQRNKGYYPALMLLGIHDKCTPELASEVSKFCAALCSFEEAQEVLASNGCDFDIKTIRNIFKRYSVRARSAQRNMRGMFLEKWAGEGRTIVVSVDGGRLRIRRNKRGPKTSKKRNRYDTSWREPKLLIIYIADNNGKNHKEFKPIIDGAVADADHIFNLVINYLKELNITPKDRLHIVSDGALWIWDRIDDLREQLKMPSNRVTELLDFYHAVEHVTAIADLKKWRGKAKKAWITKVKNHFRAGNMDEAMKFINKSCEGTENKDLIREQNYFIKNKSRMKYGAMERLKLPLGSGAIESTIRRVINLRLKGAGIFWKEETANEMIFLRSYYKAKRWEDIKEMASQMILEEIA